MANWGAGVRDAGAGAATGAAVGSVVPGVGTAIGAGIGAIGGGLLGLFSSDDQANADQAKLDEMKRVQAAYGQYRPALQQAHMNALQNRATAFQGANNVLASMYGPQGSQVPTGLSRDPAGYVGPGGIKGALSKVGQ